MTETHTATPRKKWLGPDVFSPLGPIAALLSTLVFVAVAIWRANVDLSAPVFIGEDFPVFWHQQANGGAAALLQPHAGYFQLVPRIAAVLSSLVQGEWAPLVFLSVHIAVLAISVFVLLRQSAVLGLAILVSLAAVHNAGEVFASVSYFQWVSAPILLGLYLSPPASGQGGRILGYIVLTVLGLSSPFALLLLPFVLIEAALLWNSRKLVEVHPRLVKCLILTFCAGLILYATFGLGSQPGAAGGADDSGTLFNGALRQVFSTLAQGQIGVLDYRSWLLLAAFIACVFWRPYRPQKLMLALFGVLVVISAVNKFRLEPAAFDVAEFGTRYFLIAMVCVLVVLLISAVGSLKGLATAVPAAALIMVSFPYEGWRAPPRTPVDWTAQYGSLSSQPWTQVFEHPFWRFIHTRGSEGARLWWMHSYTQPERQGDIGPVNLAPGNIMELRGAVDNPELCGLSIPVSLAGIDRTEDPLPVGIAVYASRSSDSATGKAVFKLDARDLQDWQTLDVGTELVGPQEFVVRIALPAGISRSLALPAQASDGRWKGLILDPAGNVQGEFQPIVWAMNCSSASPFGDLQ